MATPDELRRQFLALRTWSNPSSRAPHKPLLALLAIGRCLRGEPRMAPFEQVDREFTALFRRFGPPRRPARTEYPFWRLSRDSVWELDRPQLADVNNSGDASPVSLRRANMHGGLPAAAYETLRANPRLALAIAEALIDAHFPPTYRDDLLRTTGIAESAGQSQASEVRDEPWEPDYETARRLRRDAAFRPAVLAAYQDRCAVCAFDVRVADHAVAVDAAHIHWHSEAGRSDVHNGLALCALHHRLFDRGAFTVREDYEILVCKQASGAGFEDALGRYHAQRLQVLPRPVAEWPDPRHLRWHAREVFRGPNAVAG